MLEMRRKRNRSQFHLIHEMHGTYLTHWLNAALLALPILFAGAGHSPAQAEAALPMPISVDVEQGDAGSVLAPESSPAFSPTFSPAQQPVALPDAPTPVQEPAKADAKNQPKKFECNARPCRVPIINWYMRFENGPQVKPLTPAEKGWLAAKNVIDPFNVITILGEAGISVAADSHSPYGPGMPGWERYVGVSFTQDLTGEFFNTFLIPSIVHQDPHYHRMPHATYPRRIFHAIDQVVWTQGDNGKGMLNYANLVGYAIDDEISNLYVPGRQTNVSASAQRYATGLATAPLDNFITEFLPDVARHIHLQIVVVQRIINQVASKDSGGT